MRTYDIKCQGDVHHIGVSAPGHYVLLDHDMTTEQVALHLGAEKSPCVDALSRINFAKVDALWWAAKFGHISIVQLVLDDPFYSAGPETQSSTWHALTLAGAAGHLDTVRLLFKHDSPSDGPMCDALRMAAQAGQFEVVKFLVEEGGAPLNAIDYADGAAAWAERNAHQPIAEYLRDWAKRGKW